MRIAREELLGDADGRYHRQALIPWWEQERVAAAHILVVGAGALGNEVLKTLALVGAGRVLVYDMDRIEHSNLSRGVLFRDGDEGAFKAVAAVRRMKELNPDVVAVAQPEHVVHRAGLGVFLWADVVICGVDNREARIFVNSACARTGRAWVDGAIEGFAGVVRLFDPAVGPCYECTMNETDRRLVAERRSCAMLARDVRERGHVPNTAVAASIIGALQVQEALKLLHGRPVLRGEGLHIDGLQGDVSRVHYPRREGCPGHDGLGTVRPLGVGIADITVGKLLDRAEQEIGAGAVIDFSRDVVLDLTCPACGAREPGRAVLGAIGEAQARCPACEAHRIVDFASSMGREGPVDRTLEDLGIPPFDVVVARRGSGARRAWLLDGDAASVLGLLADDGSRV